MRFFAAYSDIHATNRLAIQRIQAFSHQAMATLGLRGLAVFCLVLLSSQAIFAQAPSGYSEAWSDEFDGNSVDRLKWNVVDSWFVTNNSLQDYQPGQVTVESGNLVITSENIASRGGLDYRSGQVQSRALQKYGRWDIRAKLPTSKGMWPAIWLLSDGLWPSEGEIDIMENRGDEPHTTSSAFHYGTNPPFSHNFRYQEQQTIRNGQAVNYHNSFHKYSVEWDPDQIRYYVDDVHHWTVRDADVGGFLTSNVGEMRLIINTAIGGDFLDNPDSSTIWPQRFEVDYVRAYTRDESGPVLSFDNGSFEEQDGSLAHWTTFGNTIGNISTRDDQTNGGAEALKLYGQFNGEQNFSGIEQGLTVEGGQRLMANLDAWIDSDDSLAGTNNEVFFKIDYYSKNYGLFGSDDYISSDSILIGDLNSLTDQWLEFQLDSIAPEEAVEARLAIVFAQRSNGGGAIFIDNISLTAVPEPTSTWVLIGSILTISYRRQRRR